LLNLKKSLSNEFLDLNINNDTKLALNKTNQSKKEMNASLINFNHLPELSGQTKYLNEIELKTISNLNLN